MLSERDTLKETKNDKSCAPQLQVGLQDHINYIYRLYLPQTLGISKSKTDFAI